MGNKTRHTANLVSDNNLFVDIANDRVGIGSTQPTAKLNVAGIVSATEYYGSGANLTGIVQDLTGKANVTISDNPPGITTAHGDLWWESDTAKGHIYYNDGSSAQWVEFNPSGGGGGGALNNIVEDPTPQLGGNLDLFGKNINGTGDINITGDVTATSFVGDGSGLTGVVGSGSGIVVQHDGSNVGTAGTINFSTNLDVTPIFAGIVTVTASGGGGISTHDVRTNSLEVYTGVSTFVGYAATYAAHFKNNIFIDAGAYAMFGNSIDKFSIRNTGGKSQLISGQDGGNVEILSQQSGSFVKIGKYTGGANDIALFTVDAGVELFHNTDKKFETTSTGANVTGILTATSIVKSGGTSSQYLMADGSVSSGSGGGISLTDLSVTTAGSPLQLGALAYNDSSGVFTFTPPDVQGQSRSALSVGTANSPLQIGAISYNNSTGVFTYTPPDLSSYLTTTGDGSQLTGIGSTDLVTTWTLGANGSSDYTFTGPGVAAGAQDPTIYLVRGQTYKFENRSGGHPFRIQYEFQNTGGTAYNDGIVNNAANHNTDLYWEVRNDAPDLLHYQCTAHQNMSGRIVILGDVVSSGSWTASAGTPQTIDTITGVANNAIKTAEYTIHIGNGSNMQTQKVLVMQDGTTAYSQEYAIMHTSTGPLVSVTADINSGNLRLLATPETGVSGTTTYTLTRQTIR